MTHNIDILSLFLGSLLGDSFGKLRSYKNNSFHINLQQENANAEYLFWFYNFVSQRNYCSSNKPKLYKQISNKNQIRFYYRINSFSFPNFKWLYDAFYTKINNKADEVASTRFIKRIPDDTFLNLYLTPLAVWIMDDGDKCSAGLKIATKAFQYNDLELIQNFLNKKYELQCNISKASKPNQFIIYFKKKKYETIIYNY